MVLEHGFRARVTKTLTRRDASMQQYHFGFYSEVTLDVF